MKSEGLIIIQLLHINKFSSYFVVKYDFDLLQTIVNVELVKLKVTGTGNEE